MKNFDWDDAYKKAKIFGIIIISISIAYYLIVFIPAKEKYGREVDEQKRIEQVASKEKEANQGKRTTCLDNSEKIKDKIKSDNEANMNVFGVKLFDDIFYSSKLNACVYIIKNIVPWNQDSSNFSVLDVATDKIIESVGISEEDHDALIVKYKN